MYNTSTALLAYEIEFTPDYVLRAHPRQCLDIQQKQVDVGTIYGRLPPTLLKMHILYMNNM